MTTSPTSAISTAAPAAASARRALLWACLALGGCASLEPAAVAPATPAPAVAAVPAATPTPAPVAPTASASTRADAATAATDAALPTAPLPRRTLLEPDPAGDRGDLWQRIRAGLLLPDLDNDYVRKWEQWYAARPEYVQRMSERGGRYLFHIVEEVERRGLPMELALLPFIESAFNPQAMSVAAASGMWQFMPATGKDFELRQNLFRDERRDVLASTRAALDFLEQLHARFGDWHLALAAYNWGPGNVQRAIDRSRRAGRAVEYETLMRMPLETREYVPKLQAVKNIVLRPEAYGLALPPLENHPYFVAVPIERDIDVDLAARLAGLPLEQFRQLNPQHNKPVILAAGTEQILLPYDQANRFVRELAAYRGPLATWTAWVAPRTLKPAEAASLTEMPEERLRELNRIPPGMLVKAGSTLLVPRDADVLSDVPEHVADNAMLALTPEERARRRLTLQAARGGTSVAAIARRYRVSAVQVAQWNSVAPDARFAAGQRIVVLVPAAAPKRAVAGTRTSATRVAVVSPAKTTPKAASRAPKRAPAAKPATRVRVAQN